MTPKRVLSIQTIHQLTEQNIAKREAIRGAEQDDYDEVIEAQEIASIELRKAHEESCMDDINLITHSNLIG